MRIPLWIILTVITLQLSGQSSSKSNKPISYEAFLKSQSDKYVGKKYPDFSVKISGSSVLSNHDLDNKVVFINFWAKHCSPCIAELNGFNQMFNKLKDNPNFLLITFTCDADTTIKRLIKKYNLQFKVIQLEDNEFYRLNFNNGIPTSMILDKNGSIKYFQVGGTNVIDQATKNVMTIIYPKITELL